MDDRESIKVVSERVSELLEELMDLIRPQGVCGNPACEHDPHPAPDGPWMMSGWVMAVDISAEGDDDELETWTMHFFSKNISTSQGLGLGMKIARMHGG